MITETDISEISRDLNWTYVEGEDLYYINLSTLERNGSIILRSPTNTGEKPVWCTKNPSSTPKKLHLLGTDFVYCCKPEDIIITKTPFWCHIEEDPSYTFGKRRILIIDK